MDFDVIVLSGKDRTLIAEALECHVEGLKLAKQEATTDRTIEEPEDLLNVIASMDEDIARGSKLLLEVFHVPADSN